MDHTQCIIGIKEKNSVKYIQCEHDGYVASVGLILEAAYGEKEKVMKLIQLGNVDTLGICLEPIEDTVDGSVFYIRDHEEPALNNEYKELRFIPFIRNILNIKDIGYLYLYDTELSKWSVFLETQRSAQKTKFPLYEFILENIPSRFIEDVYELWEIRQEEMTLQQEVK